MDDQLNNQQVPATGMSNLNPPQLKRLQSTIDLLRNGPSTSGLPTQAGMSVPGQPPIAIPVASQPPVAAADNSVPTVNQPATPLPPHPPPPTVQQLSLMDRALGSLPNLPQGWVDNARRFSGLVTANELGGIEDATDYLPPDWDLTRAIKSQIGAAKGKLDDAEAQFESARGPDAGYDLVGKIGKGTDPLGLVNAELGWGSKAEALFGKLTPAARALILSNLLHQWISADAAGGTPSNQGQQQ